MKFYWKIYSVSQKFFTPAEVFWNFPKRLRIFNKNFTRLILVHTSLNCKILFSYPQLWQSYVVLSVTTRWIFTFHKTSVTSFTNWW